MGRKRKPGKRQLLRRLESARRKGKLSSPDDTEPTPKPARKAKPAEPLVQAYTVEEVAVMMQVSRRTLDRAHVRGDGPPGRVKVGGQVRYLRQVLDPWLKGQP